MVLCLHALYVCISPLLMNCAPLSTPNTVIWIFWSKLFAIITSLFPLLLVNLKLNPIANIHYICFLCSHFGFSTCTVPDIMHSDMKHTSQAILPLQVHSLLQVNQLYQNCINLKTINGVSCRTSITHTYLWCLSSQHVLNQNQMHSTLLNNPKGTAIVRIYIAYILYINQQVERAHIS